MSAKEAYQRDQQTGDFNELKRICIAHGVNKIEDWLDDISKELDDIPAEVRGLYFSISGSAPK